MGISQLLFINFFRFFCLLEWICHTLPTKLEEIDWKTNKSLFNFSFFLYIFSNLTFELDLLSWLILWGHYSAHLHNPTRVGCWTQLICIMGWHCNALGRATPFSLVLPGKPWKQIFATCLVYRPLLLVAMLWYAALWLAVAQWHALGREEQSKYYELARKERQVHMQLHPGWTARDNYAQGKKRKRRREKPTDAGGPYPCQARVRLTAGRSALAAAANAIYCRPAATLPALPSSGRFFLYQNLTLLCCCCCCSVLFFFVYFFFLF